VTTGEFTIRQLFHLDPSSETSLQKQIIEQIVAAIAGGHIPTDKPLPPSRILASQLGVARNTVSLAYGRLKDDGYLISRERSGFFVNPDAAEQVAAAPTSARDREAVDMAHWMRRLKSLPSSQRNIQKPADWQRYPYPFIYGQLDFDLFPTNHWRECCRDAMSVSAIRDWADDHFDNDDPLLIEQIHQHLLPRRGVWADTDQILITIGAQQALYMIIRLLMGPNDVLGLEEPGYVDIRNIAALNPTGMIALPVDNDGLMISKEIDDCSCVYVTPSHQSPTTVTMPLARRHELLARAKSSGFVIIEDDYESEIAYSTKPTPALKSLDKNERVLYVGSLSKTLSPGLRLGYVVGPAEVIKELRALRRLMLRHPPANNQRSVALFLARGYHDTLTRSLISTYKERCEVMKEALDQYLPSSTRTPVFGGSSFWVRGHNGLDTRELQVRAAKEGILIEPGDIHFLSNDPPSNFFRLGFASIKTEKIEPGIKRLAAIIREIE
jgi:GntR family transcriptional regulator/MocR family aminotransferase